MPHDSLKICNHVISLGGEDARRGLTDGQWTGDPAWMACWSALETEPNNSRVILVTAIFAFHYDFRLDEVGFGFPARFKDLTQDSQRDPNRAEFDSCISQNNKLLFYIPLDVSPPFLTLPHLMISKLLPSYYRPWRRLERHDSDDDVQSVLILACVISVYGTKSKRNDTFRLLMHFSC